MSVQGAFLLSEGAFFLASVTQIVLFETTVESREVATSGWIRWETSRPPRTQKQRLLKKARKKRV